MLTWNTKWVYSIISKTINDRLNIYIFVRASNCPKNNNDTTIQVIWKLNKIYAFVRIFAPNCSFFWYIKTKKRTVMVKVIAPRPKANAETSRLDMIEKKRHPKWYSMSYEILFCYFNYFWNCKFVLKIRELELRVTVKSVNKKNYIHEKLVCCIFVGYNRR